MMHFLIGDCSDVRDFLMDYIDHRLPLHTMVRFRIHLKVCPPCARFLARYRSSVDLTRNLLQDPPPEELVSLTLEFLDSRLPKHGTGLDAPGEAERDLH
jgi:hypothetical protein